MTDIRTIWQTQPREAIRMITLADIRARAAKFETHVRWRNLALYGYSVANIAITVWLISTGRFSRSVPPGLLLGAAHLFVIWQLWWRARSRSMPDHLMGVAALDYLRHELERQHQALSGAWLWYILPFMPGLVWLLWLRVTLHPAHVPPAIDHALLLYLILSAIFFWVAVGLGFLLAASRLELRIERLNTLRAE
jgi:hypothetical protein